MSSTFTPATSASMSKEKLRNELQARNIPLPPANSKKDVYVQLYEAHIANDQNRPSEFSSDEEDANRRTENDTKIQRSILTASFDADRSVGRHNVVVDGLNVSEMSDDDLRHRLLNFNVPVGPIVESTRSVYERKLSKLLRGEIEGEIPNGKYQNEDFSDSDGEVESMQSFASTSLPSSPLNTTFETRKKTEEPAIPKLPSRNVDVPDNILTNRGFLRDTPTPRRSLRDNISYTPTDRILYADLINRDSSTMSKLASKVVENTPEPMMKENGNKKSTSWLSKALILLLCVAILVVLVYYNMEKNVMEEISHLPGNE